MSQGLIEVAGYRPLKDGEHPEVGQEIMILQYGGHLEIKAEGVDPKDAEFYVMSTAVYGEESWFARSQVRVRAQEEESK